tara:strand:+ start:51 stop:329 length:279 start_codon:yes stop_codon:yes gene_type:complete
MSIREKIKDFQDRLKDSKENRAAQFTNYLNMVDKYSKKRVSLKGSMVSLGNPNARAGSGTMPKATKMSTIMSRYHDRALRLAQAKYYQKQVG